ncbi:unnamed protein product [Rotaria sp. Silwood1]|nr:unnamed protein product [Rotaria sp. Silwood1]CAF3414622.1 unnamed protein product [Rotaria sp. Silwood1]CAF3455263.1 unnamed protein product [Rotaria sp. Silwood1]CAF4567032.1 unnamed protein product [Rotaria sp. Silwood1]CAF4616758.1 unnamed protein product [Rotaria sp. Silwood1]
MAGISSDVEHVREQYNAGKSKNNALIIEYHNKQFHDGDELKRGDTQVEPKVQINVDADPHNSHFTLVMIDPDAPQRGNERAGPWLHWIKAGFVGNDINSGKTLADYQGPAPPSGTGPHQYVFLLYKSATSAPHHDESIAVSDSGKRKQYHLKKFEKDLHLQLVAATSYTVIG